MSDLRNLRLPQNKIQLFTTLGIIGFIGGFGYLAYMAKAEAKTSEEKILPDYLYEFTENDEDGKRTTLEEASTKAAENSSKGRRKRSRRKRKRSRRKH